MYSLSLDKLVEDITDYFLEICMREVNMAGLEKYIEERYSPYFIFGTYEDGLHVDVSTHEQDILYKINKKQADLLISQRDELLAMTIKLAKALNEVNHERFVEIYYNGGD